MKTTQFDEIEDFNKAINNWKNQKTEEVANYVEAGNPLLQFSNDNACLLYTSDAADE